MSPLFRSILLSALLAPSLTAQIVVDPAGGAAYRELQAAIDAAPAGAVIRVLGGQYGAITIQRSLTIVGDPAPLIASPSSGIGAQPAGITLQGDGSESLTLANVVVRGIATYPYNSPGAGIASTGFHEIRIVDSSIHGHRYERFTATGVFPGAPALRAAAGETPLLWIDGSHLEAADAGTDGTGSPGYAGSAAIDAPGATVIAIESTIIGGDGSDSFFPPGPPSPTPCPCPQGWGVGGDALVAATYFVADTLEIPGAGGAVFAGVPPAPWGVQPPGMPVNAGTEHALGIPLNVPAPMQLGRVWIVSFPLFGTPAGAVLLGAAGTPLPVGSQWLFVDARGGLFALPFAPGTTSLALRIPNVAALGGAALMAQVVWPGLTTLAASRPAPEVVRF